MTKEFLRECLNHLKNMNYCYVFTLKQVDEVIKNCKMKVMYEPNECGYTIKKIKENK